LNPLNAVPSTLTSHDQWVAWRLVERNGKKTKVPIDPHTGCAAATNNPATWGTFEEACLRAKADQLSGVGFVFTADDPFTGIDLDKCLSENGDLEPWAQQIVTRMDSYTEVSPSGRGLHIILRATLPEGGRRKGHLEMYDRGRFFCVTGDHWSNTLLAIGDRQAELEALHAEVFGHVDIAAQNGCQHKKGGVRLSDTELIQRASSAKNGARFKQLWRGDWQGAGYTSQSEADLALCNRLAFWTASDEVWIDSLFRRSGLYRSKWDEAHFHGGRTYGQETIVKSCASAGAHYGDSFSHTHSANLLEAGAESSKEVLSEDRPTINAGIQDLSIITKQSWDAIKKANQPPYLFRFGGLPSRLEPNEDETAMLRDLTIDRLRHELARAVRWVHHKQDKSSKEWVTHDAKPPTDVVRDMLACPEIPLPRLRRIVQTPVFSHSGALLSSPGYHDLDQVYYLDRPRLAIPALSSEPTAEQVNEAKRLLLEDLLGDFPFVSAGSKAHALACLLLPFVRDLIAGPTPLHMIEKPTPRTGGTLLATALVLPAVGGEITHVTERREDDEWGKLITTLLLRSPIAICIDNLRRRLESSRLASAITGRVWTDRILGHSEKITVPIRTVWLATGNNPALSDEMLGRTVFIRLDAHLDRPQDRTEFRHSLPGWAFQHRAELVWAALILCQAWIAAGRPKGEASKGGFEEWSAVLGGILHCVEVPGFLTEPDSEFADPEAEAWKVFLGTWWDQHQDRPVGIAELFNIIEPDRKDPIDLGIGEGSLRSQKICLGKKLIERRDRQFSVAPTYRLLLKAAGYRHRAQLWTLKRIAHEEPGVNV
jgi:hypothetical protein